MQPIFPAAIISGRTLSRLASPSGRDNFRPRSPAAGDCKSRRIEPTECPLRADRPWRSRDQQKLSAPAARPGHAARNRRCDRPRGVRSARSPRNRFPPTPVTSRVSRRTLARFTAKRGIVAEHEAVILHRRAAAGGVDDDRVEPARVRSRGSRRRCLSRANACAVLAEMMVERAATARALGDHDFAAVPGQQPRWSPR